MTVLPNPGLEFCFFQSRCDHHHRNGKQRHCGIQPMASEVNVGAKPPARASHATLGTLSTKSKSNQELKRQEAGHPGNIGNPPSDGKNKTQTLSAKHGRTSELPSSVFVLDKESPYPLSTLMYPVSLSTVWVLRHRNPNINTEII